MTSNKRPTRFRIFNPHRLTASELRDTFVARIKLFDAIIHDIVGHSSQGIPQHHLVVGQRGMGKTTLLQRIAIELFEQPHQQRFLPLTFPEELIRRSRSTVEILAKLLGLCGRRTGTRRRHGLG